jgi:hypothetical protein
MGDTLKGLTAYIYRNPMFSGCSLDGISARCDQVTVVGTYDRRPGGNWNEFNPMPKGAQIFAPTETAPPVALIYRRVGGKDVVHAEPLTGGARKHYMAGGSYIDSSDSRLSDMIGFYGAVSFHDRCEV